MTLDNIQFLGWVTAAAIGGYWIKILVDAIRKRRKG